MAPEQIRFGAYIAAKDEAHIAVIISTGKQHALERCDVLYESGKTLFDLTFDQILDNFHYLFTDAQLVLDGCSCNPGWKRAHDLVKELKGE